ncbi:MAG: hypothetical protein V3V99_06430 [candidate division Zixibacteria bacterium]
MAKKTNNKTNSLQIDMQKDKNVSMEKNKKKILVIGDLFIDENWLMAKHESYSSTNVGKHHYISYLEGPKSMIFSLCGVGNSLKILYGPGRSENLEEEEENPLLKKYELLGVSAWNPRDNEIIECVLCPKKHRDKSMNPYKLEGLKVPDHYKPDDNNSKAKLRRICPYDDCPCELQDHLEMINLFNEENSNHSSTNRIFRIYEGFGGDQPELLYRFDWKLEIDESKLPDKRIKDIIKEIKDVEAVVIVDHGKGVINDKVIEILYEKYKDKKWYVRLKRAEPSWLNYLKKRKKKLRLIIKDEQLIKYQYGIRRYRHGAYLGRGALEAMGDMLGLHTYKHGKRKEQNKYPKALHAAILFEDNSALAASRPDNSNDANMYYIPPPSGDIMPIQVGRTSIFFNSLIHLDLMSDEDEAGSNSDNIYDLCGRALSNMYRWTQECTDAWHDKQPDQLSGPFDQVIMWNSLSSPPSKKPKRQALKYGRSWEDWNRSSKEQGIILRNKNEQRQTDELQVWRSCGTLTDYICPGGAKRSAINNLISSLNSFSKIENPKFPFNCLFISEPGWGKSYLARCLSDHFDFEYLPFSIAQMASNEDLIDSFKVIVSTQKRTNKKVLVFMDETDARIEGHNPLGLFLGPMWDGEFKIEGNTNKIDPCVWVFALTKPADSLTESDKGRDFLSRINGHILNLDYLEEKDRIQIQHKVEESERQRSLDKNAKLSKSLRTELVYQGIFQFKRSFGPITHVDKKILELFYNIRPKNGIRSLQIFVNKFTPPVKGIIRAADAPKLTGLAADAELSRHISILEQDWYDMNFNLAEAEDNDLVKISFQPDR